jgi:hypothetical protein
MIPGDADVDGSRVGGAPILELIDEKAWIGPRRRLRRRGHCHHSQSKNGSQDGLAEWHHSLQSQNSDAHHITKAIAIQKHWHLPDLQKRSFSWISLRGQIGSSIAGTAKFCRVSLRKRLFDDIMAFASPSVRKAEGSFDHHRRRRSTKQSAPRRANLGGRNERFGRISPR